jgi:hypothetical protein
MKLCYDRNAKLAYLRFHENRITAADSATRAPTGHCSSPRPPKQTIELRVFPQYWGRDSTQSRSIRALPQMA